MLRYSETNWKYEKGFDTYKYELNIHSINSSLTTKEQQSKNEKISLVAFLNKEQKRVFVNLCKLLKRNDSNFYQNSNLHVTIFGFGPIEKKHYMRIRERIRQFSRIRKHNKITISFEGIRLGTMYTKGEIKNPVCGMSNGTVIAIGNVANNEEFYKFGNNLTCFLLIDDKTKSILGANFRRKFPSVWCTLGYYNKKDIFRVNSDLENILSKNQNLSAKLDKFSISEISLVKSKFKNLRYPEIIQTYKI